MFLIMGTAGVISSTLVPKNPMGVGGQNSLPDVQQFFVAPSFAQRGWNFDSTEVW